MIRPYALIIEHRPELARRLAHQLDALGYQTQVVATGHEAQARLNFTNPDLVLLDASLPTLPAPVVLRQINGQPRLAHTRVVLLVEDPALRMDGVEYLPLTALETDLPARLHELHLADSAN